MGDYGDLNDYEIMYLVEENNEIASDVLFQKYKPIVISIATQYKKQALICGLDIDDLIQEGYLGLYYAIRNYDCDMDAKFYTYAILTIRSKIINFLNTRNNYKHMCLNQSISLFEPLHNFNQFTLIDAIEDKNAVLPHVLIDDIFFQEKIKQYLYSLKSPHSYIFELKLNGFKNHDICELLELNSKKVSNILLYVRKDFQSYLLNN